MGSNYPHVFSPIEIRGLLFKNRIELAPPGCLGTADERGFATDRFVNTFRQFARAGVAIVSVGNCTIDITESSDEGGQLELKDTAAAMPLNKFAKMCESFGAYGSLELTHNGKDTPFETVGHAAYSCSSFVTVAEKLRTERLHRDPIPTIEMSREKIKETVEKYANAAWICKKAGLKMLMIHGAHGNLIAQFASPYFNKRTDEYGGSLENRARFAIEILDAIRARVGERFVIEYRLSAEEFHPEQMHFDETLKFIGLIKDKVDILHVSAGIHDVWGEPHYMRYLFQPYMLDQMYNVHFAADVKKAYPDLIVNTVGSIKDIRQAEEIIASGKADFVSMHRALNADFDMLHKFASGRDEEHVPCLRCACVRMGDPPSSVLSTPCTAWPRNTPRGVSPRRRRKRRLPSSAAAPLVSRLSKHCWNAVTM